MKVFQIISFFILIFEIQTQTNNTSVNNTIKPQNNSEQIKQEINIPKNDNKQNINETIKVKLSETKDINITNKLNNTQPNSPNENKNENKPLNNTEENKKEIEKNTIINPNSTQEKEDKKNKLKEGIIKEDKKKDKPFNLTESLINFFQETFGKKDNKTSKEETEEEKQRKKMEEEKQKKLIEERDRKRKEEQAKLEKIKMEEKKQKEKKEKYINERNDFVKTISNNTFEEVVPINLEKGEKETLYLDLEGFTKIKLAVMVTDSDPEEKINFFFSGPNSRGRTAVIYQLYNKNYLFWEYETLRKGEFFVEITNKGTKDNEIYLLLNKKDDKKSDKLDTQKLDKISMLLNEIDANVNQLRNKKKIEIKQVNSHNKKVGNNNKWIVIYSIIEISTMIMVFVIQSCYINSLVNKV